MKDAQPTFYHHFIGFRKFTTKLTNLRREPVHVVFLCDNYFFFCQKNRSFLQKHERNRFSTGQAGSARETGSCRVGSNGEKFIAACEAVWQKLICAGKGGG